MNRRVLKNIFPSLLLIGIFLLAGFYFVFQYAFSSRTLRWAHVYEISSPYHQQALWAAKEFERLTDSRYQIKVYAASSLGKEVAINEAVNLGSVDLIYTGPSLAAQQYGPLALSDYPYVIENFDHWQAYRDSELFQELAHGYANETGDQILELVYYGFRHVASNKPIRTPADMVNLKIRVPNALPFLMMPQNTGANPAPIPFSEAYLALQQGVVEASENPLTTIKYKRFYEVQSHINLTAHIANSLVIIAAGKTLGRMSPDDAALLRDTIKRAGENVTAQIRAQEQTLLEWYPANGITIVHSDQAAFRKAVQPALYRDDLPFGRDHLQRLLALANEQVSK